MVEKERKLEKGGRRGRERGIKGERVREREVRERVGGGQGEGGGGERHAENRN